MTGPCDEDNGMERFCVIWKNLRSLICFQIVLQIPWQTGWFPILTWKLSAVIVGENIPKKWLKALHRQSSSQTAGICLKNARESLQKVIDRYQKQVPESVNLVAERESHLSSNQPHDSMLLKISSTTPNTENISRNKIRMMYEQICELHQSGMSIRKIASQLRIGRRTVRRYLRADSFPKRSNDPGQVAMILTWMNWNQCGIQEWPRRPLCGNGCKSWDSKVLILLWIESLRSEEKYCRFREMVKAYYTMRSRCHSPLECVFSGYFGNPLMSWRVTRNNWWKNYCGHRWFFKRHNWSMNFKHSFNRKAVQAGTIGWGRPVLKMLPLIFVVSETGWSGKTSAPADLKQSLAVHAALFAAACFANMHCDCTRTKISFWLYVPAPISKKKATLYWVAFNLSLRSLLTSCKKAAVTSRSTHLPADSGSDPCQPADGEEIGWTDATSIPRQY